MEIIRRSRKINNAKKPITYSFEARIEIRLNWYLKTIISHLLEWFLERKASREKPPMTAYRHAIRLTRMFNWYSSVESVSMRASMCCSCAMMSPRVTSLGEEEGADVDEADQDEAEREGGATDPDCFDLNCTSLRLTVAVSMAHI